MKVAVVIDKWEPMFDDGTGRKGAFIKLDGKYFNAVLEKDNKVYCIHFEVSKAVAYGKEMY